METRVLMSHRHCGVLPRGEVTYDPANDIDQDGVDDPDTYDDNTFALVYTTAGLRIFTSTS